VVLAFRLRRMVMASDRSMIASAHVEAIKELDGKYGAGAGHQ
jgi:hypothetical protein